MADAFDPTRLESYPQRVRDTARYGDTDANGHLNNAAFATFLETGRIVWLMDPRAPLAPPGHGFAIVRLELDFRAEMHWGGDVLIGTAVTRIGNKSFELAQAIFQDGKCAATARETMVLLDLATRRAVPVAGALRAALEANLAVE
jgi:acyl-CoA thioester hydrolase